MSKSITLAKRQKKKNTIRKEIICLSIHTANQRLSPEVPSAKGLTCHPFFPHVFTCLKIFANSSLFDSNQIFLHTKCNLSSFLSLVTFHLSLIIQPQSSIAQQAQPFQVELKAPSSATSQYLMVFISLCYVYLLMGLFSWIYYKLPENIDCANFNLTSQATTMVLCM